MSLSGLFGKITFGTLGLYYASNEVAGLSLPSASSDSVNLVPFTTRSFPKGFSFAADIRLDGTPLFGNLPKLPSTAKPADPGAPLKPSQPEGAPKPDEVKDGSTFWWEANKTIGPVLIRRVGFSYADVEVLRKTLKTKIKHIGIKFDAGLTLGPLAFSLLGAGIRFPIDKLTEGGFTAQKVLG